MLGGRRRGRVVLQSPGIHPTPPTTSGFRGRWLHATILSNLPLLSWIRAWWRVDRMRRRVIVSHGGRGSSMGIIEGRSSTLWSHAPSSNTGGRSFEWASIGWLSAVSFAHRISSRARGRRNRPAGRGREGGTNIALRVSAHFAHAISHWLLG